jgi:hypothetical protein
MELGRALSEAPQDSLDSHFCELEGWEVHRSVYLRIHKIVYQWLPPGPSGPVPAPEGPIGEKCLSSLCLNPLRSLQSLGPLTEAAFRKT